MPLILHCRHCQAAYRHVTGVLPESCPTCTKPADWQGISVENEPRVPYKLSLMDQRFLKGIKIQPEVEAVTNAD